MTNTELFAKIKAEIDKRYAEYREKMKTDDFTYYEGMADALDLFEQFIDTLESEKPINPEAAMKEIEEKIALVKQRGTWDGVDVDKFMDEVRGREPEKPMVLEEELKKEIKKKYDQAKWGYVDGVGSVVMDKGQFIRIARHFAEWGAKHLASTGKTLAIKPGDEITINGHKIIYDKDKGYVTIVKSEESVPNDLEEAAKGYRETKIANGYFFKIKGTKPLCYLDDLIPAFIAGANWQKEQMMKNGNVILSEEDFDAEKEKSVEWGYSLCKEQMMKEAIHYVVQDDLDSHGASYNIPFIRIGIAALKPKGIGVGDKVRIIIVKEDEK